MPDWWINRIVGFASWLVTGLMLDWHWFGCALAWLAVGFGFLIWSIAENEGRP